MTPPRIGWCARDGEPPPEGCVVVDLDQHDAARTPASALADVLVMRYDTWACEASALTALQRPCVLWLRPGESPETLLAALAEPVIAWLGAGLDGDAVVEEIELVLTTLRRRETIRYRGVSA